VLRAPIFNRDAIMPCRPEGESVAELLGENYKQLYGDYYDDRLTAKRLLAAQDTLEHIRGLVGPQKFGRVIDVGAGEGSLLALLHKDAIADRLYAVEISDSGLQAINARSLPVDAQRFDGYNIPYADRYFDLVIAIHIMEHVEHERLLLREMRRVGKRLFIEVPIEGGLRVERAIAVSGPYGHINFYVPSAFLNLMATTGFKVLGSRVLTSSLRYEQYVGGKVKGRVKHMIRRAALKLFPRLAPSVMTYVMAVYCEPK
jgi:SAM-dependent methyltransferase